MASDLQTLRAALEAEPRDRACWAAYGDAFEDRYGQEARRALACRRVRSYGEFQALKSDLARFGLPHPGHWPWAGECVRFVQYSYGLHSYAALRSTLAASKNFISTDVGTFRFLSFLGNLVRRVTWRRRPGEVWGCSQRQTEIELLTPSVFEARQPASRFWEVAPGFYASLVVASGWSGGEVPDYVAFPTKKAAKRALSLAVLNLARRKAGLPLLPPLEVFA